MPTLKHTGPADTYRQLAELPLPTSAVFISPQSDVIRVTYSIRDHERNIKRSVIKSHFVASGENTSVPVSHEASEIVAFAISPSKARSAILREVAGQNGSGKSRFVEIWAGPHLEASMAVTNIHGAFHADDFLGSLSFSPSESALLYTAEVDVDAKNDDPYPKFQYTPHFGETLYSKKRPTIFLFRWRTPESSADSFSSNNRTVTPLSLTSALSVPVLLGQAVFASETRIFATGYEHTEDGRLLGIKGCFNRPSGIWELTLPSSSDASDSGPLHCTSSKLTPSNNSCRSPRILRDANGAPVKLVWLSSPSGGAHASGVILHSRDLRSDSSETEIVVDTVWDPAADAFPGLYTEYNLQPHAFLRLGGSSYIVAQSLWRSRVTVLLINTTSGDVRDVTPAVGGDALYSWNVLCTDGINQAVCSRSTPMSPPEILLGRFDEQGNVQWKLLEKPVISPELRSALEKLDVSIIPVPGQYPTETIIIQSKQSDESKSKPPCITIPHGGPHATSTTAFSPGTTALVLEGYTISQPNYTGSMGFGEKYIQKLLGQCGTLDIAECIATVNLLITLGISESGKQFIHGGSHGGFIAAHLIGQYPDTFKAAVMRNPVISMGELPCLSDIPDWGYAEMGLPFTPDSIVTPEIYKLLYDASPIAHIEKVKTPVLLLIGEDDHRVPPSQGVGYYYALKGRSRPVAALTFPKESHPLDGVEAARVGWEAARDWMKATETS
ncbi:Alpha/Beta hydrolase protein [Hygrophoropsis aurantiaca]|uniref:Alpha/Beta hydrolase protein n=1 Tax=Hygrophoropsis aurantiaca TaxID=72124 RepID=A0ACB8ADI8_9AGAM|nr:Alpha/Beta hydrolase protein [Hygrophoropsis aurantiaca]